MTSTSPRSTNQASGPKSTDDLFNLYASRLVSLAEASLSSRMKQRVDGEDVVQSVFRTFLRRRQLGQFDVENASDLWQLLVRITLCKVRSQSRKHTAKKRNVNATKGSDDWLGELQSREPGPQEAAIFLDLMEEISQDLEDAHREILSLRLQGVNRSEIARQLGITRQSVHRVLKKLQTRLEGLVG